MSNTVILFKTEVGPDGAELEKSFPVMVGRPSFQKRKALISRLSNEPQNPVREKLIDEILPKFKGESLTLKQAMEKAVSMGHISAQDLKKYQSQLFETEETADAYQSWLIELFREIINTKVLKPDERALIDSEPLSEFWTNQSIESIQEAIVSFRQAVKV